MADDKKSTITNKGIRAVNLQLELKDEDDGKAKKKKDDAKKLKTEIFCIITIVIGCLILLSLSTEQTGYLGSSLNFILTSMFGFGAFVLPVLIIAIGMLFFLKKEEIKRAKVIYCFLVFLCLISLIYIMGVDMAEIEDINNASKFYSNTNGGFVGGIIGSVLIRVLGKFGSYVFIWTCILILGILITGKSFFEVIMFVILFVFGRISNLFSMIFFSGKANQAPLEDETEMKTNDKEDDEMKEENNTDEKSNLEKKNVFKNVFSGGKNFVKTFLQDAYQDEYDEAFEDRDINENLLEFYDDEDDGILLPNEKKEFVALDKSVKKLKIRPKDKETYEEEDEEINHIEEVEKTKKKIAGKISKNKSDVYIFPPIMLLNKPPINVNKPTSQQKIETSRKLEQILKSYGVEAEVRGVSNGPTVTRFEVAPGRGVKVSRISSLSDDLALNLAATGIRIEAPIPGKSVVGIEIPNKEVRLVTLKEVIEDETFKAFPSKLAFGIGIDISGKPVISDIGKMPHLLIAGATGSGKSVCINTLITSILYKSSPEEVQLLMIDPKVVELSIYIGIPHLIIPVVTDPKKAAGALNWAVEKMLKRYALFADSNVRDLKGYNEHQVEKGEKAEPQIVIIIDELADLMMAAPNDVENSICRLAQMARAAGIHLIIATQRPSVDVITGVIKANIPSRLAFSVSSGIDSRTILDMVGAEKLLGKGDMLFYPVGYSKPVRIQGAFISDKEVENIVKFIIENNPPVTYSNEMIETITSSSNKVTEPSSNSDEFMEPAMEFIIKKEKASASMLQRQFRIGYNRASRIIEELEELGLIGKEDGSKPRKVLMTLSQFEEYKTEKGDNK